jgi:hypothetical protein
MEIRSVAAELFHADRETDMKKLTVAFGTSVSAPNKQVLLQMKRVFWRVAKYRMGT